MVNDFLNERYWNITVRQMVWAAVVRLTIDNERLSMVVDFAAQIEDVSP
jgi:hypothetical protein